MLERLTFINYLVRTRYIQNIYSTCHVFIIRKSKGIGYDLRENSQKKGFDLSGFEKYSESLRYGKPLQFENEKDEQQFVSEAISRLTMAEVFVVYSHFKQRLSSPYRNIRYFFGN